MFESVFCFSSYFFIFRSVRKQDREGERSLETKRIKKPVELFLVPLVYHILESKCEGVPFAASLQT
jgi:hypothetical protein